MPKPQPYRVTFTDEAKAAAEASSLPLADIEARARAEIGIHVTWEHVPGCEMDLPAGGFCAIEMPNGTRFIALLFGPHRAEIDAVAGHESAGPLNEETADMLGVEPAEVVYPVPAARK